MDFWAWIEPVLAKFCGSILGIEKKSRQDAGAAADKATGLGTGAN
jgi:hypothetical protein